MAPPIHTLRVLDEDDQTLQQQQFDSDISTQTKSPRWSFMSLESKFKNKKYTGTGLIRLRNGVLDLKMRSEKDDFSQKGDELCCQCQAIPFRRIGNLLFNGFLEAHQEGDVLAKDGEEIIYTLMHILHHRNQCTFCRFLFKCLCQPSNDPLAHPAIRDYIQDDYRNKSFSEWAEDTSFTGRNFRPEKCWPFGQSRDPTEARKAAENLLMKDTKRVGIHNPEGLQPQLSVTPPRRGVSPSVSESSGRSVQLPTDTIGSYHAGELAGVAGVGVRDALGVLNNRAGGPDPAVTLKSQEREILTVVETVLAALLPLKSMQKTALSAWVIIKFPGQRHEDPGRFSATIHGYGRAPRASLSNLGNFTLYMESPTVRVGGNKRFLYGQRLNTYMDLEVARHCFDNCLLHHGEHCGQSVAARMTGKELFTDYIFLIDVYKNCIVKVKARINEYLALSYVWGPEEENIADLRLKVENLSRSSQPGFLSRGTVCLTIWHAMQVTKKLQFHYLWVDRLCIVQDDRPNKSAALGKMASIYGNAAITLVAADNLHARQGLSGLDIQGSSERHLDQIAEQVVEGVNVLSPAYFKQVLAPWDTRAWTLEEMFLSKRILVFTGGQWVWHCRTAVACEDLPPDDTTTGRLELPRLQLSRKKQEKKPDAWIPCTDGSNRLVRPPALQQYVSLVRQYSGRRMDKAWDVLNAMKGLMNLLNDKMMLGCSTGLAKFHIPPKYLDITLLWQPVRDLVRRKRVKLETGKLLDLPSWSWIGWEAAPVTGTKPSTLVAPHEYHPAVQYEEPFKVCTDKEGRLLKEPKCKEKLERMRPLLRWYVCHARTIELINNGNDDGLGVPPPRTMHNNSPGVPLPPSQGARPSEWEKVLPLSKDEKRGLLPHVFNEFHLIFRTSCAIFNTVEAKEQNTACLCREWSLKDKPETRNVMLAWEGEEICVGKVRPHAPVSDFKSCEFVVISEAQYLGNEEQVDVIGYPLYNVMLIQWDARHAVASRGGLGKIYKWAWELANPRMEIVILG